MIGWSKYGLGLPSDPLNYGLTWTVELPTIFQSPVTVPLHNPNGRQMGCARGLWKSLWMVWSSPAMWQSCDHIMWPCAQTGVSPSGAGPKYALGPNFITIVPADGLAPNGARPSASAVFTVDNYFYWVSGDMNGPLSPCGLGNMIWNPSQRTSELEST